jgi:hypothetical protein
LAIDRFKALDIARKRVRYTITNRRREFDN